MYSQATCSFADSLFLTLCHDKANGRVLGQNGLVVPAISINVHV